MKKIASAQIDGSTMHEYCRIINEQIKVEFKNKASVTIETNGRFTGRLFLSVGDIPHKPVFECFKGFASHAVAELGYNPF